jgi:hypothetical protein
VLSPGGYCFTALVSACIFPRPRDTFEKEAGLRLYRPDADKVAELVQLDLLGHVIENQDPEGAADWPHSLFSRTR